MNFQFERRGKAQAQRERVPGEDKTLSEEVCPPTDSALSEAHFRHFATRGLKRISDLVKEMAGPTLGSCRIYGECLGV